MPNEGVGPPSVQLHTYMYPHTLEHNRTCVYIYVCTSHKFHVLFQYEVWSPRMAWSGKGWKAGPARVDEVAVTRPSWDFEAYETQVICCSQHYLPITFHLGSLLYSWTGVKGVTSIWWVLALLQNERKVQGQVWLFYLLLGSGMCQS